MLHVGDEETELHESFERELSGQVEGFKTPKGFSTKADRSIYLTKLPPILAFQQNVSSLIFTFFPLNWSLL